MDAHPQAAAPGTADAAKDAKLLKSLSSGDMASGNYYPPSDTEYADPKRKAYADFISQDYNFRYGKDHISTPGNAMIEDGAFVQPGAFPNAAY